MKEKNLHTAACFGYSDHVTERNVTGLVARSNGGHTATSVFLAVFLCPLFMASHLWAGHVGSRKTRRSVARSTNLHEPALFAFGSVGVEKIHFCNGEMS